MLSQRVLREDLHVHDQRCYHIDLFNDIMTLNTVLKRFFFLVKAEQLLKLSPVFKLSLCLLKYRVNFLMYFTFKVFRQLIILQALLLVSNIFAS
jgi:hypothetical protein